MRYTRIVTPILIFTLIILLSACDKGKKPYEEAEALLNQSEYSAAKNKAQEIIQNFPKSKYASLANAIIEKVDKILNALSEAEQAIQGKDYSKAIKSYEDVLALDPKSAKANEELQKTKGVYKSGLLEEGNTQLQKGNYEEAIKHYKAILAFEPNALM